MQNSVQCAIITVIAHNGTTSTSIAAKNPFTYRGYYYDKDLGLYYLQTRYYDSVTGRFINADGYVSTGQGMLGNNMFAYCNNNPVMFVDPTGELFQWIGNLFGELREKAENTWNNLVSTFETVFDKTDKTDEYLELQGSYTTEQAQEAIQTQFKDLEVTFNSDDQMVVIKNSYLISSKNDRLYISTILSRTEGVERTAENIAAEWAGHNVCYIWEKSDNTKDYNMEYVEDSRGWIRGATKVLDFFGIY